MQLNNCIVYIINNHQGRIEYDGQRKGEEYYVDCVFTDLLKLRLRLAILGCWFMILRLYEIVTQPSENKL